MRISDWSSDVCSSDLAVAGRRRAERLTFSQHCIPPGGTLCAPQHTYATHGDPMTTANAEMLDKIKSGRGFIAALDQSGGSTPKALKGYGIGEDAFSNEEEMFALIHAMRSRIVTSPCFNGDQGIGAILFWRTMDGEAGGKPGPAPLVERTEE